MQTFGTWPQGHTRAGPTSASILIWLAGFPTDFPVVGCERPNVLESRVIARELREQAAPIEPCGTRLDIFRIAGFDMAGDLLQRRCPITANCNQNRQLVENLATN